jgi:hypothetical protein
MKHTVKTLKASLVSALEEALTLFGSYQLRDKGIHEVIDTNVLYDLLTSQPATTVRQVLEELYENKPKVKVSSEAKKHLQFYVASLVSLLDDTDDKFFDVLLESPILSELY